jgi:hypothetical protein
MDDLIANVCRLARTLGPEAPAALPEAAPEPKAAPVKAKPAAKATPAKATPAPDPAPDATVAAPRFLDFNTEVAPHVVAAVDTHGKELVASVLTEFGVARASEIPPEHWPEFLNSLADAIAAVAQ